MGTSSSKVDVLIIYLDGIQFGNHHVLAGNWLREVEIEGSLDYVATGLPKRGDVIDGQERFLDNDSPWSFSLVFVFPLAPLVP